MSLKLDSMTDAMQCCALNHLPSVLDAMVIFSPPAAYDVHKKILERQGYEVRKLESAPKAMRLEAMKHYATITDWSAFSKKWWNKTMKILNAN